MHITIHRHTYIHMCMLHHMCAWCLMEAKKENENPWNYSLWSTMWVLGTEPGSSTITPSILKHRAISLAPHTHLQYTQWPIEGRTWGIQRRFEISVVLKLSRADIWGVGAPNSLEQPCSPGLLICTSCVLFLRLAPLGSIPGMSVNFCTTGRYLGM